MHPNINMSIYWNTTDVVLALAGGTLISISTILNLLFMGRITGMSGMLFSVIRLNKNDFFWKSSFIVGLISSVLIFKHFIGDSILGTKVFDGQEAGAGLSLSGWIIGSLLVGLGTLWGNGCTSGHAVCGLPRLSPRSLVATLTFMAFGVATATLRDRIQFFTRELDFETKTFNSYIIFVQYLFLAIYGLYLFSVCVYSISSTSFVNKLDPLFSAITGMIFGFGLILAGMCRRTKILGFLTLKDGWDPSLMFVMASAVGINLIAFNWILSHKKPLLQMNFTVPTRRDIDYGVIFGPALFGIGWGITGLCPGPAMLNLVLLPQALIAVAFIGVGQTVMRSFLDSWNSGTNKVHKA